MYESPKQLIRDFVPTPLVSFEVVARVSGALYLASIILPAITDRIGFAEYSSGFFAGTRALSIPFDIFELMFISTLGTLAGLGENYEAAGGGVDGVGFALLDFIVTPVLYVALPVTGFVLTAGIVVLGIAFLLGYDRYTAPLIIGFLLVYTGYIAMFGMKTATLHPQTGLYFMYIASLLMFIVAIDREHEIGLVSDNGYTYSKRGNTTEHRNRPLIDNARLSNGVLTVTMKVRELFSRTDGDVEYISKTKGTKNNVDSNGESADSSGGDEDKQTVSYAGSAKR